jgi:hypothetical protein
MKLAGTLATAVLLVQAAARPSPAEPIQADEPPQAIEPPQAVRAWRFAVTPYLWIPAAVSGEVTLGGNSVAVHADMGDLLGRFELGGTIRAEAWWGEFGLMLDVLYVRFGDERTTQLGELDVGISQWLIEAALAYRLGCWPTSDSPDAMHVAAQLYAGLRMTRLSLDIEPEMGPEAKMSEWYFDPMIGLRIPVHLSPAWTLSLRADVGSFGVDSDLTWNVVFGLERALSPLFAFQFGYRIMTFESSKDVGMGDRETSVRTTTHGPGLALSVRF